MNYHKENDKQIAAFLLLSKELKFEGTEPMENILYFLFSPSDKALLTAQQYIAKQATPVQPKDFAEACQTITDLIWKWRKSRDERNGGSYGKFYK